MVAKGRLLYTSRLDRSRALRCASGHAQYGGA